MIRKVLAAAAMAVAVSCIVLMAAVQALAAIHYFQGFETDTYDWSLVNRVASGTNGIASAAGNFHAEADSVAAPGTTGDSTHFGGYESTFPAGGYTTSMDVYLDVSAANANDTRFDWSSAINKPDGTHRRDFVFNAGFYNDADATGSGPRFVINASTNATRSGAFPKNSGSFSIFTTGWYTFEHHFYKIAGGVLAVDLRITELDGTVLKTWTRSDATDIIGTTVGGHRYGWLVIQEFPILAIDNVSLLSVNQAGNVSACKSDGWQQLTRADGSIFTNQGDCIQYVNTGK
jgi:hypothetical protein